MDTTEDLVALNQSPIAMATDGKVAELANRIVKAMILAEKTKVGSFSEKAKANRVRAMQAKIYGFVREIETSGHIGAAEIATAIRFDVTQGMIRFVAARARQHFDFPKNWTVVDHQLVFETAAPDRTKKIEKARADVLKDVRVSRTTGNKKPA